MVTVTGLREYLELAEKYGLSGESALKYANEQIDRAERAKARQEEREEKTRQEEREERELLRRHELEMERLRLERAELECTGSAGEPQQTSEPAQSVPAVKRPKLPAFTDGKDDLDSYLNRFERLARVNGWDESEWAVSLSALLSGRALEVYTRMKEDDANDYTKLKTALLHRYGLTGEGYRIRMRDAKPEQDESPQQFIYRLSSYLQKWVTLTKTDQSFEGLKNLIIHEQFMSTCPKQLAIYLREKATYCLEDLAEYAQKYLEAHDRSPSSLDRRTTATEDHTAHAPSRTTGSATALRTSREQGQNCLFCQFPHPTEDCRRAKTLSAAERREQVMRRGACFLCFQLGHLAAHCREDKPRCPLCGGKHNQLVCAPRSSLPSTASSSVRDGSVREASATAASNSMTRKEGAVLMQTAQVKATGAKGARLVRIMLDSGSNQSFIRTETARKLGCEVLSQEHLRVHTFGGGQGLQQTSDRVKVTLSATYNEESKITLTAYEIPVICSPPPAVTQDDLRGHLHLAGLKLAEEPSADPFNEEIDILIGLDYMQDVIDGRMKKGGDGPVAIGSRFGWILAGRSGRSITESTPSIANFIRAESTDRLLEELWNMESIGISSEGVCDRDSKRELEELATKHFEDTCDRLPDGRYEVRWPWKPKHEEIPTNEAQALARLEVCERQLRKNGRLKQYDDAMQDYLEQGHAEKAPAVPDGPVHVLPHHAVYKDGKVRVVFDAAAGRPNQSLNDHLLTGPNLIADLTGVLLRFRTKSVGVTADIEKAFLQLSLHSEDRDVTRFLWREKATDRNPVVYRMTRVVFGVKPSPFLLQAAIRKHLQQYGESDRDLVDKLQRDIYCDDLITSVDTQEEAQTLAERTMEIFEAAKMNMRKWTVSQSAEASSGSQTKVLGAHPDTACKVLGINWDPDKDKLVFETRKFVELATEAPETKRSILRMSARFFDPLGMLTPFSVRTKIMLKQLWLEGLTWDQRASDGVCRSWRQWLTELHQLNSFSVPRPYGNRLQDGYQLHIFCDASKEAYAAVAYIRAAEQDQAAGPPALVMSKSRLTPRQPVSLPRLELTAALIGARLAAYVRQQLHATPQAVYFWTDSMVALHWIRSDARRWGVFVKNRVCEIQSLSSPAAWGHCPGAENPADLPSRGAPAEKMKGEFWLHGPAWLREAKIGWPQGMQNKQEPAECKVEERKQALPASSSSEPAPGIGLLINIQRFSSLNKLLRITAYVLRWICNSRSSEKQAGTLTAEELARAERLWILDAQHSRFSEEVGALKAGHGVPPGSRIKDLSPFLEGDVLRKEGRLHYAPLPEEEKRPIILPPDHRFVNLLIEKTHKQLCHAGTQQVLSAIRDRYWIVRGRQKVRSVLLSCRSCHLFRARPFYHQRPAPLPRSRTTPARPFSRTGVDFAGPLYVRQGRSSDPVKAYIAVFTCAVVRAVHLEMVKSLTTEDFMKAYRRFSARRGCPASFMSDNATTFRGAASVLATEGVKWHFIVERAPWWGGFWERMVGLTKAALRRTLGSSLMLWEELETVLCSVESAINARPLTPVSDDPDDIQPLRPADFLHCAFERSEAAGSQAEQLTRRRRYQQRIVISLWTRWQREYLRNLRDFRHTPSGVDLEPAPGDVVLIEGERSSNRLAWITGTVKALHPGRDGRSRAATVHTHRGDVRRPIQKLYLLEAASPPEE